MSAATSRYARAFVDVVVDGHLDANRVLQELQSIAATAHESLQLRQVWESPAIPAEQKRGLLDAIVAQEGVSRPVRNLIAVLIDHRRIGSLDQVVKTFVILTDAKDFAAFNAVYATYFPTEPPARTTVEAQLMIDIKIEVEAVAYRPV